MPILFIMYGKMEPFIYGFENVINKCVKKLEYYAIYLLFCPVFSDNFYENNYCRSR